MLVGCTLHVWPRRDKHVLELCGYPVQDSSSADESDNDDVEDEGRDNNK